MPVGYVALGRRVVCGHAREVVRVLAEVDDRLLRHLLGDRHRRVRAEAHVARRRVELVDRDVQQSGRGALRRSGLSFGSAFAVDGDDLGDAVVDEHLARCDRGCGRAAPRRRRPAPGCCGADLERLGGHHLQVPERDEQRGEQRHARRCRARRAAEARCHPGEVRSSRIRRTRGRVGAGQGPAHRPARRAMAQRRVDAARPTAAISGRSAAPGGPGRRMAPMHREQRPSPAALPTKAVTGGIHHDARITLPWSTPTAKPTRQ